ncbi:hypothetical protein K9K85_00455 [Patescibacteria group bacterium]|nr:hypothetical protein [Patescibacteria group bacterium]
MKKRDALLLLIIILLIGAFILLILGQNFFAPKEEIIVPEDQETITDPLAEEELEGGIEEEAKEEPQEVEPILALQRRLENKARFFIERYNTFSSDNEEENLYSVLAQASSKFALQIENLIRESSARENKDFYSLQTKVLSIERIDFIEGERATFKAQVQETEEKGGIVGNSYKEVELIFVYEDGEWKVDSLSIGS